VTRGLIAGLILGLFATEARAYQVSGSERIDYTAYTLKGGELSIGLSKAEIGVTSELMLGTYVLPWFTFPWTGTPISTGYVKVRDPFHGSFSVSGRCTFVYADVDALVSYLFSDSSARAKLILVPLELGVSARFSRRFTQSLELSYVSAGAGFAKDSHASIRSAGVFDTLTLSSLLEFRFTRVFAATLLARGLLYQSPAHVRARFKHGSTHLEADLGVRPRLGKAVACVLPGVSFSWQHANLELALGYGAWWLPIVQLPEPKLGLVAEGNFYFRF
jgi:hypothetical protein